MNEYEGTCKVFFALGAALHPYWCFVNRLWSKWGGVAGDFRQSGASCCDPSSRFVAAVFRTFGGAGKFRYAGSGGFTGGG
ncbi:hypothetical protein D3C81_2037630 [compost metagenome]